MSSHSTVDYTTPEKHLQEEKQHETVSEEPFSLTAADDPYVYFDRGASKHYFSPHSTTELRLELNRSKLGKTHKKLLLTELAYLS
jgi:hypothetical protein